MSSQKLKWEYSSTVERHTVYVEVAGSNPVTLVRSCEIKSPLSKNLCMRPFGIRGFGLANNLPPGGMGIPSSIETIGGQMESCFFIC